MDNQSALTGDDILHALQQLGVEPGMRMMVHSSLSSFGIVAGGAATVVRALMAAVTPAGTLLMPSFNHGGPFGPKGPGIYDPATTPTSNGAIPETFRQMPGVYRSLNPTHPYAAWGAEAASLLERHHLTLTMGPDSPLGLLAACGGYGLLLGTNYHTNTFKHVVETTLGAPCLGRRTTAWPTLLPDGTTRSLRTWTYRASPCPISDPDGPAEDEMEIRGLHHRGLAGNARLTLFRLADFQDMLADLLRSGYAGHPPCSRCPIRPAVSGNPVASDWNDRENGLNADSEARAIGPLLYRRPAPANG